MSNIYPEPLTMLPVGEFVFSMSDLNWLLLAAGDFSGSRPVMNMGHICWLDGKATLLTCDMHRIHAIPFAKCPKFKESIAINLLRIRNELRYAKCKTFTLSIAENGETSVTLKAPYSQPEGTIWPQGLDTAPTWSSVARFDNLSKPGEFRIKQKYLKEALSNPEMAHEGVRIYATGEAKYRPLLFMMRRSEDCVRWAIVMPMSDDGEGIA